MLSGFRVGRFGFRVVFGVQNEGLRMQSSELRATDEGFIIAGYG
jgi:hypothetical protein